MVRAILEGRKTQTRRIIKKQPVRDEITRDERMLCPSGWPLLYEREFKSRFCPYGAIGDVLWVRETWCRESTDEVNFFFVHKAGNENYPMGSCSWKPSIHMPKEASRIWLEITDIRVERVQEISEADAVAEGVMTLGYYPGYKVPPRGHFEGLWTVINGPKSWETNPFVWVVCFKVLSTTGKPENI